MYIINHIKFVLSLSDKTALFSANRNREPQVEVKSVINQSLLYSCILAHKKLLSSMKLLIVKLEY